MLHESPSAMNRLVTSLKVAALVTVLGTVVLAAERQLVAADKAPAYAASTAKPTSAEPSERAPTDYFPSHFPAPKGEPAEPTPTF